jgi:hypothetical protein
MRHHNERRMVDGAHHDEQAELLSKVRDIWDQLRGPNGDGWPQLGQNNQGQDLTPVDAIAAIKNDVERLLPST